VSIADRQAGVALATIGSMAQHVVCDRQGRIGFSPQLLSYAGLGVKEKVVLVGAVTTIQVWSPALWDEQRMDSDKCLDVIQALQEKPEDSGRVLQALIGRNA
jgi:DNA-binding transcriptional regulator/RsmH inhibitor MraZ